MRVVFVLWTALAHAQREWMDPAVGHSEVPLIHALVTDDIERATKLLTEGADPNVLEEITPLYAAQEYVHGSRRRHAIIRKLLQAGALADRPTRDGSTTLMLAVHHGDVRSAQMLLNHGADPLHRNSKGASAIEAAQQGGHDELSHMLREHIGESGLRQLGEIREPKVEL